MFDYESRMKDEVIKDLVASKKLINRINLEYQQKIEILQKENTQLKSEIEEMQRSLASQTGAGSLTSGATSRGGGASEPNRVEL